MENNIETNLELEHIDGLLDGNAIDIIDFASTWLTIEDLEQITARVKPQVNQYKYKETKSACTIINAYKDACYLYDISSNDQEMLEVVDYATKNYWYVIWRWWFADIAMKTVERRWETKRSDKPLFYSCLWFDDPMLIEVLKRGYMVWCTYKGNTKYNQDYQSDCVLNGASFWVPTYWHRTSLLLEWNKIICVDSASGNVYNEYEIKDFTGLVKNKVMWEAFYVFTKEVKADVKEMGRLTKFRNNLTTVNYNYNQTLELTTDPEYIKFVKSTIAKNNDKIKTIDSLLLK